MISIPIFAVVVLSIALAILGFTFGMVFESVMRDKKEALRIQVEEQQRMWSEYISALKGGNNVS
jgi:hypothetical protein